MDLVLQKESLEKAKKLHEKAPVVNAHLDLAGEILLRHQLGEKRVLLDRYLPEFECAGLNLVVSSIYVPNSELDHAWENTLAQIDVIKQEVSELQNNRERMNHRRVCFITSKQELSELLCREENVTKTGILLYMEGLDGIGEDLSKIDLLYQMGVRGASLTWSRQNALATGCCKASEYRQIPGGLTEKGKEAVKCLEQHSMFLDISHLNDDGFEDVCQIARRPFTATHSNSKTICNNYRNLTDRQMCILARQHGVAGLNGYRGIAGSKEGNHLEMLCRHVEYEVECMGMAHVGYGFDLCDSYDEANAILHGKEPGEREDCLYSHAEIPQVTAALLQRGMDEKTVRAVIGENWIRYFSMVLPDKNV